MGHSGRKGKFKGYDPSQTEPAAPPIRPHDRARTLQQPHRRMLDDIDSGAAEAESPIGRLLLAGHLKSKHDITGEEPLDRYNAAVLYVAAAGAYRSVIGAPKSTSGGGQGYPCEPDSCKANNNEGCECLVRQTRYKFSYEALARVGRRALMAVNRVAVHREAIAADEIVYLVAGLDALVTHFGLKRKKRGGGSS